MAKIILMVILLLMLPSTAIACEPLAALALLFGLPAMSLSGIVIVKALVFAWLEKSLVWYKAIGFTILANLFSSLIGLLLGVAASAPFVIFLVLPFVYVVSVTPSKRFIKFNPWGLGGNWHPKSLALVVAALYLITFVLFGMAQATLHAWAALYWLIKFGYILVGLTISIGLTTLWEERIISKLSNQEGSYLVNVLKVNLMAFLLITLLLAARALPERLASKNFLI